MEVAWYAVHGEWGTLLKCQGKDMMNDVTVERPDSM
jgi:hypothetical protein